MPFEEAIGRLKAYEERIKEQDETQVIMIKVRYYYLKLMVKVLIPVDKTLKPMVKRRMKRLVVSVVDEDGLTKVIVEEVVVVVEEDNTKGIIGLLYVIIVKKKVIMQVNVLRRSQRKK
ncbi:hypothetical protein HanRHA438_Chr08g0362231 [Helianthus annuus]|nr:hypothetical protein HanRHA438_Chr08g0362231 [Helianthus annuus]